MGQKWGAFVCCIVGMVRCEYSAVCYETGDYVRNEETVYVCIPSCVRAGEVSFVYYFASYLEVLVCCVSLGRRVYVLLYVSEKKRVLYLLYISLCMCQEWSLKYTFVYVTKGGFMN